MTLPQLNEMTEHNNDDILLHVLDERLKSIQKDVHDMKTSMGNYVTQHEFRPVMLLVYGFAATALAAVIAALVALVLK